MKRLLVVAHSFLFAYSAVAQQRPDSLPAAVNLQQCIQYALANQPAVKQAQIDERITDYEIRSRLADWFPQIGFNYSLQRNFQRQTNFFNGTYIPIGAANVSAGQLAVTQNIFNRDLLLANRTQGDVRLQSRQVTTAQKIDVTVNVSKAFYDVLATQQQIKVAAENIVRLQKSLSDAFRRYEAGVNDKTDYKRAQIALNNTTATKQTNEAALVAKLEYLKNLMGYPATYSLNVVYDSLQLEREVVFDTLQRVDFPRRIEFQQLALQRRLQEANVVYQRNAFLPTIAANGGYNFNYLNNNFGKLYSANFPNSFLAITAGFPIFQGGRRKLTVKAAELQVVRVDLDIINVQNNINSEYANALGNYKGGYASYLASKANVALAQEVYDVIQLQYRSGIKTYLEVVTAETDLRTAQINYFNTLYAVLAAKVDAERALGLINP